MASGYGAGQYEDAFSPSRLQHWSVARSGRQRPSPREGSTRIITNNRGHLLPSEPRSQASPWGTFVGTWDMPSRIPPARLDLSSRSAASAARLTEWVLRPTALTRGRNGLCTDITGRPQEPRSDTQTAKEPSRSSRAASSEGIRLAGVSLGVQLEELPGPGAGVPAAALLSHDPDCAELQPRCPSPCSHQPVVTDPQRGDTGSPETSASIHPTPRQSSPRQATLLQVPATSRGVGSCELRTSPCAGRGRSATSVRAEQPPCTGL